MTAPRRLGLAVGVLLSATLACSSDEDGAAAVPLADGLDTPAATASVVAAWANPVTVRGERIGALRGESFQVDVYQVAVVVAEWDAGYRDSRTGRPTVLRGDQQVVLNYVFTHTGDAPSRFAVDDLTVLATAADAATPVGFSLSIPATYARLGLNSEAKDRAIPGASVLWEPGTSFAVAQNVPYRRGQRVRFSRFFASSDVEGRVPFGAAGDKAEAEASVR